MYRWPLRYNHRSVFTSRRRNKSGLSFTNITLYWSSGARACCRSCGAKLALPHDCASLQLHITYELFINLFMATKLTTRFRCLSLARSKTMINPISFHYMKLLEDMRADKYRTRAVQRHN